MLVERYKVLCFLPKLARILKPQPKAVRFLSALPETVDEENLRSTTINNFRLKYPEFLPNPDVTLRNPIREKLERRDMLRRRNVMSIPEFYVGTIMAVTSSNKHALGKTTRFVGICIQRENCGLNTKFLLRNVVDNHGVEVQYYLYSPLIQRIEILRLEKRLDDELFYLRDAPYEYSYVPFDKKAELDVHKDVPINTIQVKINPRPWYQRYERMNLKGVILPPLSEKIMKQAEERAKPWEKYDLMDEYRKTIPEEEQKRLLDEVSGELKKLEVKQKIEKKKKVYHKPSRQKLF